MGRVIALRVHGSRPDDIAVRHSPEHVKDPPVRACAVTVVLVQLSNKGPLRRVCKCNPAVNRRYQGCVCIGTVLIKLIKLKFPVDFLHLVTGNGFHPGPVQGLTPVYLMHPGLINVKGHFK